MAKSEMEVKMATQNRSQSGVQAALKPLPIGVIRDRCLKVAQERFGTLTGVRASLSTETILEILKPFRGMDWSALGADALYRSRPGTVSRTASGTGETAAQRAWFNRQGVDLPDGHLSFMDAEVPVCPGKDPRRRCVDLLGAYSRSLMPEKDVRETRWVVVELKYAKTSARRAGSPPYAMLEALAYAASLYANRKENGGHLVGHVAPEIDVATFPDIAVVANRAYWTHWQGALGESAKGLFDLSGSLQRLLATAFPERKPRVGWYAFPDLGLDKQKGKRTSYEPRVPSGSRWQPLRGPSDL